MSKAVKPVLGRPPLYPAGSPLVQVTTLIRSEDRDWILRHAAILEEQGIALHVGISDVVRRAVSEYIERHDKEKETIP